MVRFISIVILALISLLAAFPAPTHLLWLLAVMVQSYPWIFAAVLCCCW